MKYSKIHVGRGFPDQFLANETWTGGYDKFNKEPFELIYRNESAARDPVTYEPISWVEVFEVNWTYIEEYHPIDI